MTIINTQWNENEECWNEQNEFIRIKYFKPFSSQYALVYSRF